MLPDHIREILDRWMGPAAGHTLDPKADVEELCEEISKLELAWRLAEEHLLQDTQTTARLRHLLRRLRHTARPGSEAPAEDHRAYDLMLEAVDREISRKN